jgi:hypothetical protein
MHKVFAWYFLALVPIMAISLIMYWFVLDPTDFWWGGWKLLATWATGAAFGGVILMWRLYRLRSKGTR